MAIDKKQLEAAIGPKAEYYLARFEAIDAGRRAGWNWPAFFLSTAWFSYRGMGGWAALNFVAPWVAAILMVLSVPFLLVLSAYLVLFFVLVPLYADALYYRRIKKEVERTAAGGRPSSPTRPSSAVVIGLVSVVFPLLFLVVGPAVHVDYTERSQVSEAISLMSGARTPVTEHFVDKGKWPESLKQVAGNTSGRYTERIEITSGAGAASGPIVITATMKASEVRSAIAGKTVQYRSEDGGKTWICSRGPANGVETKYLPGTCR